MLKKLFGIFRIQKEERAGAIAALLVFTALNALNVARYFTALSGVDNNTWAKFIKGWHVSGFDPITYSVITKWTIGYNIYRHPLLPYFVWPFSKLNEGLMALADTNFAIIITAGILVFCAFYAYIFLNRIFREIIGVRPCEGYVLSALTFSFAYIMLSTLVPDHFCPSMFCLILTLYLCGLKLQRGRALNWWQTVLMFFFTAGISLNNGLKIFLAAMVTRGRRFFRPGYLLVAVLLPSAIIWGSARWSYKEFVWPKEVQRKARQEKIKEKQLERIQQRVLDTIKSKDSISVATVMDSVKARMERKKELRKTMSAAYKHTGKPMAKGEFLRWTDISTSRTDVTVESLFGEGIMLHEDYLLKDVLVNRPVIVRYHNWGNYIVEAFLVGLFLIGIWCGRRSRFLWTAMSFFLMDMALHIGLGFGINEVFIMSAHYLFVLPMAMAFMLKSLPEAWRRGLTAALAVTAMYLWIWNTALLVEYLYF
ncbi:MAG: DUF6080 domain-containing protein [Bacteroidales bacterium]|nr:DUF6080 domain-containing protein [Bacteroidales bacterium]MCM1148370.1 DUF6080 domain-containing protein [Bacteroidales bacterium]MCM1207043.1 DUF6080 domain-containing protein [Bacillota bacterium]MCM1511314.1 DUF6080 domain-containing protein [Clostridium sp.]